MECMNENSQSEGKPAKATLRQAIGRRIVRSRKRKGWSQAKLASRLGISRERVGNWERGLHAPSLEDVARLSGELEVTLEELVLGNAAAEPEITTQQRSEAASCLNAFLRAIRPWLQPPAGNAAVGLVEILSAQRNDAAICLDAFLRVVRPWLQPPSKKEKKTE